MDLDREGVVVDVVDDDVDAPDLEGAGEMVVRAEPLLATRLVTVVAAAERVAAVERVEVGVAVVERVVVEVEREVVVVEVERDGVVVVADLVTV